MTEKIKTYRRDEINVSRSEAFVIMWFISEKLKKDDNYSISNGNTEKSSLIAQRFIEKYFLKLNEDSRVVKDETDAFSKLNEDSRVVKDETDAFSKLNEDSRVIKDKTDDFSIFWELEAKRISSSDICNDNGVFNKKRLSSLRKNANFAFLGGKEKRTEFTSRAFLDMMCFYGQNCSFEEFRSSSCLPMFSNDQLEFLCTRINHYDAQPAIKIIDFFHENAVNTIDFLKIKVNNVLTDRILGVFEKSIDKGSLKIPADDYPEFLRLCIQYCDAGFGINVPKYHVWDSKIGEDILEINQNQNQNQNQNKNIEEINDVNTSSEISKKEFVPKSSTCAKGAFQYIRILFVEGDGEDKKTLKEKDETLIYRMLKRSVRIVVIFINSPALEGVKIDKLDACILNENGYSYLLGTEFLDNFHKAQDNSDILNKDKLIYNLNKNDEESLNTQKNNSASDKVEGVFFFKKNDAKDFFYKGLKPILLEQKLNGWIFEAKMTSGQVNFKSVELTDIDKIGDLVARLENICITKHNY